MDPYRLKLLSISNEITERELVELKFVCKQHIPVGVLERINRPLELFDELENRNLLTPDNKEFLAAILAGINRLELRDDLLGETREGRNSSPLSLLQQTLFDLYKDVIGWLQPLTWNKSFHIHIKHIYTNLQMITQTQKGRITEREPLETYVKIFEPRPGSSKLKRILIEGQAGVGKSTFVSLIVYDWACGNPKLQRFKLVLFMELKEMKGNLKSDIFELLFPRDFYYSPDHLFQYIIANQESVLFILDGYDEVNPSHLRDVEDLIMGKIFRNATVVITSRPGKGSRVHWFMDSRIEITGFTTENIHEFVLKYFQDDVPMAQSLIAQLEMHPVAENIARIPLTAMLICAMWEEMPQAALLSSMTSLFIELTLLLVKRYYARQTEGSFDPVNLSSLEDIPDDLFQSLLSLGEISLNGLVNDQLLFDVPKLEKACVNKGALDIGFLSKESGTSRLKPVQKCRFSHRSYQEFLAALWLSHKIKQAFTDRSVFEDVSVYIMKCLSSELNSVLFLFTPGLLGDSFQPFFELLLQEGSAEVEEDVSLRQSFFEVCLLSLYESNQGHLAYRLEPQIPQGVVQLHHFSATPYKLRGLVYFLTSNLFVKSLVLEESQVDKKALQVLARFLPEMASLRELHLKSSMITDESLAAFTSSLSSVSNLQSLGLTCNLISEDGLGILISSFKDFPNLRHLDIQGNKISDAGFDALASALSLLPNLEELYVGGPVVSDAVEGIGDHSSIMDQCTTALSEMTFISLMKAVHSHPALKQINLSPDAVPVGRDPAEYDRLRVS